MVAGDRYIAEVLENLFGSAADKERLASDLRAHFNDGRAAGESESEIVGRLGPPKEVAASFIEGSPTVYAGFWIRALAFVADGVFIAILIAPLSCLVLFVLVWGDAAGSSLALLAITVPLALWALALLVFYFPILEHYFGCTLGKKLLGLRVETESRTRVSLGRAFLRRLSFYFEFLVLDALFVPFTEKKQRAFDLVAKTIVVRENLHPSPLAWGLCVVLSAMPLLFVVVLFFLTLAAES